jgi:four helix bundle protein
MKNAKCKLKNAKRKQRLIERLLEFRASAVNLALKLGRTAVERHIALQLVWAATSSGANYEEACAGESRADFIHKMQIVLKELRESLYRLRLIEKAFRGKVKDLHELPQSLTETRIFLRLDSPAQFF